MAPDTADCLYYSIYRHSNCTNDDVLKAVVEDIKDFVFETAPPTLTTSDGYTGFYAMHGRAHVLQSSMDLWKMISVLFKLSETFEGLVFSVSTDNDKQNPFYIECEKNEVIPKWISMPGQFTRNVMGCGGVLHLISPDLQKANPKMQNVELIRNFDRQTRNILITEAVQQRVILSRQKRFGMSRVSVSLPLNLSYLARQRPDLLALSIRENSEIPKNLELEKKLETAEKVMIHAEINEKDFKVVTALADIDAPIDIVSHRIGLFLLHFDAKYSSYQNGVCEPEEVIRFNVEDAFEKERLSALSAALLGHPHSIAHQYQKARALITEDHIQICKNILRESAESSTDQRDTACSGDDEDQMKIDRNKNRKKVYKKKNERGELGKKRELAPVLQLKKLVPAPPSDFDYDFTTPTSSSCIFHNFERAANGDDAFYKESSEERSLGEEEEIEFFAARSKPTKPKPATPRDAPVTQVLPLESDDGFDVADLLSAAPPLAPHDEDFDDI